MNESTSVMGPPAVGNKDNLNAMGDAEDPCCGPGTTGSASTSSSPSWRRRCKVKKLRGRLCRMQAFGIVFTLAGALAYTSQINNSNLVTRGLALAGGTFFVVTGLTTILSCYNNKSACLLLFVLILSFFCTLYSMVWIMAFQVVLATSNSELQSYGQDIGTGFPYLLASQYFLAGLGAVLGVLTSAFATTILREETFFQSAAVAAVAAVTGATDAGDEGDDAPEGEASEDSGEDQACNSTTHNRSSLLVVNSGSGDLILRQGERELLSN